MKLFRAWGPVVVWMAVIFVLSSRQSVEVSSEFILNFLFFKTLHIIEYAILFVLYLRASRSPVTAFLLTIAYAISDEIHQTFVPTREGKARDVIIDALGAAIAWITIAKLLPILPRKLRKWVRR